MQEWEKLQIPYPRPKTLSDPWRDFTDLELQAILAVEDRDLGWKELASIFQIGLPAGNYEECAYFIPAAFRLIDGEDDGASDLIHRLIFWCDQNFQQLDSDRLLSPLLQIFRGHFREYLAQFVLCANADGWLYPRYSSEADETLLGFNEAKNFPRMGDEWLAEELLPARDFRQAGWLLWFEYYMTNSPLIDQIRNNAGLMTELLTLPYMKVAEGTDLDFEKYWQQMLQGREKR